MGKPSTWDNAKTEKLKEMHKENKLSAKEMGIILGYSKNAIIGKLFRLGLCESKLQYKNRSSKLENYNKIETIEDYDKSKELIETKEIDFNQVYCGNFENDLGKIKYEKGKGNHKNIVKGVLLWVSRLLGMMKKLKN